MKINRILTLVLTAASFMGAAHAQGIIHDQKKTGDIVAVASDSSDLSTLVKALQTADLVATLQSPGPFTVFAPTDAAFAKLPKGTLDNLLKPMNEKELAALLTYHVVPANVPAADVKTGKVKTVNGKEIDIKVENGTVTVDGAKVTKTDIPASNGVIHLIDTVLMP